MSSEQQTTWQLDLQIVAVRCLHYPLDSHSQHQKLFLDKSEHPDQGKEAKCQLGHLANQAIKYNRKLNIIC